MTMKHTAKAIFTALLIIGLAGAAHAGNGKGGGQGGKQGGESAITPSIITFRDLTTDRVASDDGTSYVHGTDGVEAFIGSQANLGNVWLKLANSPRGLLLDFSNCISSCNPSFVVDVISNSAIKLEADKVQSDGLWGMSVGTTIFAPMRIFYDLDDGEGPGFVDFDPTQKGKSPCKNKGNYVEVTRTSDSTWDISADDAVTSCVTLPGGKDLGGVFIMPFSFTVEVISQ